MIRGENNCGIESNCLGLVPDFFYPSGYQDKFLNYLHDIPNFEKTRLSINTELDITAGGIDPTTGYTRRAMMQMPWIPYGPPVNYKDLPVWSDFVAGINSDIQNRLSSLKTAERQSTLPYKSNNKFNIPYIIFILLITFLILLVVFIK